MERTVRLYIDDEDRPIVNTEINGYEVCMLIDTGAVISVFTKSEDALYNRFPNAVKQVAPTPINWFSEDKCTFSTVYQIPEFKLGNITIKGMPLAHIQPDIMKLDLIIADKVFLKSNVFYPENRDYIDITSEDIKCTKRTRDFRGRRIIDGIEVLTQSEFEEQQRLQQMKDAQLEQNANDELDRILAKMRSSNEQLLNK